MEFLKRKITLTLRLEEANYFGSMLAENLQPYLTAMRMPDECEEGVLLYCFVNNYKKLDKHNLKDDKQDKEGQIKPCNKFSFSWPEALALRNFLMSCKAEDPYIAQLQFRILNCIDKQLVDNGDIRIPLVDARFSVSAAMVGGKLEAGFKPTSTDNPKENFYLGQ
jgi:hypothetical protein